MLRLVITVHRWLGIAIGWLVVAWCLSGIVMLYVGYPELDEVERRRALDVLDLSACCRAGDLDAGPIDAFSIEMLAGRPVLRTETRTGQRGLYDLFGGGKARTVDEHEAAQQAADFLRLRGSLAGIELLGTVVSDQWTVAGGFRDRRPFFVFADVSSGQHVYVSQLDGTLSQATTRSERAWNYVGAVLHWLYPTWLRSRPALWSRVVILASGVALFLALVGAYLGLRQLRGARYRGLTAWHHWTGLVFGLVTLGWLLSGLVSMNPGGLLETGGDRTERRVLAGPGWGPDELRETLGKLTPTALPPDTRRLESAPAGRALIAFTGDGRTVRLDGRTLERRKLESEYFAALPGRLRPGSQPIASGWLCGDDAYFYGERAAGRLPVYRLVFDDGTRYYVDATTGGIVFKADAAARGYRWLFSALHRGDFAAWSRARPWKDMLLLPLLAGAAALSLSGSWLGLRRLRRRGSPRVGACGGRPDADPLS